MTFLAFCWVNAGMCKPKSYSIVSSVGLLRVIPVNVDLILSLDFLEHMNLV